MSEAERYDVIVVGTGVAGSCAAIEALEAGASVLMLDGDSTAGGSSRNSSGVILAAKTRFQAERGIKDDPQSAYEYYMALNRHCIQPAVARRLAYEGGPTVHWLADRGVKIIDLYVAGGEPVPRGHVTLGGGQIIEALHGQLQKFPKLDIALNSYVERLLHRDGTVYGVATADYEVEAGAVVLATGGMESNLQMLAEWYPQAIADAAGNMRHMHLETARGDGIRLGRQVGAQIVGSGRGQRSPVGPLTGVYLPGYALIVNSLGLRYYDESSSYGLAEAQLTAQPGHIAYVILDDATKSAMKTKADVAPYLKYLLADAEPGLRNWTSEGMNELVAAGAIRKADTLESLARLIGIPPASLAGTVERYNRNVAAGEDADYLKNSAWLRPVSTPPYYASPLAMSFLGVTGAGIRIDQDATVLHETARSIPGLYAAGECTGGVLGDIYVGSGNSLVNCSVFGRVAGRNAAARALSLR